MNDRIQQHQLLCNSIHELYVKKNKDYGNSFGEAYQEWGPITAITRITDKWNRIKSIIKNKQIEVKEESLKDTVLDLANYFIMWYMELDENKESTYNGEKFIWRD